MLEFGPYKQQERTKTFPQKLIFQDSPFYSVFIKEDWYGYLLDVEVPLGHNVNVYHDITVTEEFGKKLYMSNGRYQALESQNKKDCFKNQLQNANCIM